jgi:hypothetical protein
MERCRRGHAHRLEEDFAEANVLLSFAGKDPGNEWSMERADLEVERFAIRDIMSD